MHSERERLRSSPPEPTPADDARRRVVQAVSDAKGSAQPADHAEIDLYLALLQDRLPVYVGTMTDLLAHPGQASVQKNLFLVAQATIEFYCQVLAAKVSVFARPAQLARLRQVMRARRIGPQGAENTVAGYLRAEQELGRVSAEVEPLDAARLLIGAGLNYAFTRMLLGDEDVPEREEYAGAIVRGLRLGP